MRLQQQVFTGGVYHLIKKGAGTYACNSRCLRVVYILSGFIHYPPFACNSRYLWVVYTGVIVVAILTMAYNSRYLLVVYTHLIFHRLQVPAYNSRYLSVVYTQSHQPSVYNMYENKNIFGFSTRKFTIMSFFLVECPINFKISYIL